MPVQKLSEVNDLQEKETMLVERVVEWFRKWKQDGLQKPSLQGELEGKPLSNI